MCVCDSCNAHCWCPQFLRFIHPELETASLNDDNLKWNSEWLIIVFACFVLFIWAVWVPFSRFCMISHWEKPSPTYEHAQSVMKSSWADVWFCSRNIWPYAFAILNCSGWISYCVLKKNVYVFLSDAPGNVTLFAFCIESNSERGLQPFGSSKHRHAFVSAWRQFLLVGKIALSSG